MKKPTSLAAAAALCLTAIAGPAVASDRGPDMDPNGLVDDRGASMDPNGLTSCAWWRALFGMCGTV